MIRARLIYNVATLPLPVPHTLVRAALLAMLACAAAVFWMGVQ